MQADNNNTPVAVITGATKGMGKAIAEKLLQEGFDIAVCARTSNDLKNLQDKWNGKFPERNIFIQNVDVKEKSQVLDFAKNVKSSFQKVDILVNNAGLFIPGKLLEEPDNQLDMMIKTNLYSVYYLTRAILPSLLKSEKAHIFNMCSVASLKAYPNGGSYSISKYALLGFTENLRYELMEQKIKVTAITPGAVWTDSWKSSGIPEKRMMAASDIAEIFWTTYNLSPQAVVENIIMRPQLGDI
jgi:NADP-dependent 3-hydroxy acid dehydrogenase YdfG